MRDRAARMNARYLVRFDDICPTMNWRAWSDIEGVLIEHHVRPILAVVPDNRDPGLCVDDPVPDFWDRVRTWQARGWSIGLHGYQHRCLTPHGGLVGLNAASEFAGLPRPEQRRKLELALAAFARERVRPDAWIAPAHSFDETTVELLAQLGLRCINDGFALEPFSDERGVTWVPQQLWRFRRMPFGVWTVCFHHNGWTARHLARFADDVVRFRPVITELGSVVKGSSSRRRGPLDALAAVAFLGAHRARRRLMA
jgi:predicted deacetylase